MAGTLMAHCGAERITEAKLRRLTPPPEEGRWRPIPHHILLDEVRTYFDDQGFKVTDTDLAVTREGNRFFGVMNFANKLPGGNLAAGLMNGWDKRITARIAFGNHVFACDNMCFFGERIIGTRHTTNIRDRLPKMVAEAGSLIKSQVKEQTKFIQNLNKVQLPDKDDDARMHVNDLMMRGLDAGYVSYPAITQTRALWYNDGEHRKRFKRSAWGLFNAYTGTDWFKKLDPFGQSERSIKLATDFTATFLNN